MHLCQVNKFGQYHPPHAVREKCPFWQWRNDQTMGSGNWFWHLSVTTFVQSVGILTLKGIE